MGGSRPTAVTVDSCKAKGPTACTKRHVIRLVDADTALQDLLMSSSSSLAQKQPNVMELAIKWEAKTPPSSASALRHNKGLHPPPVEKTLAWLFENEARADPRRTTTSTSERPVVVKSGGDTLMADDRQWGAVKAADSTKSCDSGVSSASGRSRSSCQMKKSDRKVKCEPGQEEEDDGDQHEEDDDDDDESGYNSSRGNNGAAVAAMHGRCRSTHLYDLDQFKVTRKTLSPPKNHFIVSPAFVSQKTKAKAEANANRKTDAREEYFPEYPLQRKWSVRVDDLQPAAAAAAVTVAAKSPSSPVIYDQQQPQEQQQQLQDAAKIIEGENQVQERDHRDNSHQPNQRVDTGGGRRVASDKPKTKNIVRSSCLACQYSGGQTKGQQSCVHDAFKAAFKAGTSATTTKTLDDLNEIVKRRRGYRAPKPAPLTSHCRFIRGTLAPPLSVGCRTDPIVSYPDFKRLNSTYRLSYGGVQEAVANQHQHQHRPRAKNLTALLNEKTSAIWKS